MSVRQSAPVQPRTYVATITNNKKYTITTQRGVEYLLNYCPIVEQWFVSTHRLALGRHAGGGRYYKTFGDVLMNCTAFSDLLIQDAL